MSFWMGDLRVGISGWRYAGWRGDFYPKGLPQRCELEFAARHFSSVEINGSFYSLQRPEYYGAWAEQTPSAFVFAVKGSRYITHMRRLRGIDTALANFFASGLLRLGDKLGPILWQFPERLDNDERFEAFLKLLPRDTVQAAALARRHDERLKGRSVVKARQRRVLRHAVEVRSRSFCRPDFIELLREHGVALCVADTAGRWPYLEDVTSDFVYIRLHGDKELYKSGYSLAALTRWAERIRAWSGGGEPADAVCAHAQRAPKLPSRDVYVYFDNDIKVRAPYDAMTLARLLGVETPDVASINPGRLPIGASMAKAAFSAP
jgi:uncharacterized protein YecE (DUF72 family)